MCWRGAFKGLATVSGSHAQLIDALKGRHIWAERYDRDMKDVFVLQDEITMKILDGHQVKLTEGEQGLRPEKYFKGKRGLDCYLKFLEADSHLREYNIDGTRVGKRIVEEVIEMCPDIPSIYVLMSWVNYLEYWLGLGKSPRESIEKGMEMGQRALAMDDSLPLAHGLISMFYTLKREYDKSIAEGERAVGLEPGGARAHLSYGMSLHYGGRPEEAIPVLQKAIRLNPWVKPVPSYTSATPTGRQGGSRKRFRNIRRHSNVHPIIFLPILPWPLLTV